MKIQKYITKFFLGAAYTLGSIAVRESYKIYLKSNPIDKMLKDRENKKRFDNIMRQTNLKEDLV